TLIDLAGVLPRDEFADVLDAALTRRLVSARALGERAVELWAPRRSGCAVVLALLKERDPSVDLRSVWEARVLRAMHKAGLRETRCNLAVIVGGRRRVIDFAWPDEKVAVEFDGYAHHSSRRAFDDDRARQNDFVDAGWRVFRLTATAMARDP